jgi:cobalt-zinc-cadmium efflux system outer membrane protein
MLIHSKFICALLIAILLNSSYCPAQEPESSIPASLRIEDAIRLAIELNPAIAMAKNDIQAAEGDKVTASKRLNPAFSLQFEDLPIQSHSGPFLDSQGITSRIDYEIERGGRRRLRTESAGFALEAQKLACKDLVRLIRLQVQEAFYRVILSKANLETSKSILSQAEQMISLNQVRFQQGDISALDLNRIELEKLRFVDDVFQAELALRNAKSSLLALLNAPDLSQNIDVIGSLSVNEQRQGTGLPPPVSAGELIQMAVKHRPDLAARIQEKKRAETEILLNRAIRSSNITVGGGYKRNMNENAVVFGVTIPLKIFDRQEGEILRANAQQLRAANQVAKLQKEVQLDVLKSHNAAEINHQRVEYIKTQQLKRAEETRQVTLESYNLGGSTLLDFLDAQRTYRDTLRVFNQALFDERISLYELASSIAWGVQ